MTDSISKKTKKIFLFTFMAHETDGDAVNELVFELGRGGLQRHDVGPVAIVECKDRRVAYGCTASKTKLFYQLTWLAKKAL